MTIGQKVRARRLKLSLTQEQLEELTGLHQTHISDIETGKIEFPNGNTIIRLANALKVTTDHLLREEETDAAAN